MLIAGVAALTIAGAAGRLLRGISGDVFGAVIEVSQAISWLAILAAQQRDWLHPTFLT
jgi:cobalamin synthase